MIMIFFGVFIGSKILNRQSEERPVQNSGLSDAGSHEWIGQAETSQDSDRQTNLMNSEAEAARGIFGLRTIHKKLRVSATNGQQRRWIRDSCYTKRNSRRLPPNHVFSLSYVNLDARSSMREMCNKIVFHDAEHAILWPNYGSNRILVQCHGRMSIP
jgi:hypothetical protein